MRFIRDIMDYIFSSRARDKILFFNYISEINCTIRYIESPECNDVNLIRKMIPNKLILMSRYRDRSSTTRNLTQTDLDLFDQRFNALSDKYKAIAFRTVA